MKFWDYGKHDLDGYQQSGDIHGKYFGTWLRQLDDGKVIIVSFGDEIKRYWLQMGNCFHGNYATPERAALEAEKLLSANVEFSERSAAQTYLGGADLRMEVARLRMIEAAAVACSEHPVWNDDQFYGLMTELQMALRGEVGADKTANAKVNAAGTASAGLPGYTAGDNTE